ncbi:hypothetical protein GCM10027082_18050 [Comamonas humi]
MRIPAGQTEFGQKRTYGLTVAVANPRNGKGPSRLVAINEAERRALATVMERCTAEHRARHRDGTGHAVLIKRPRASSRWGWR